MKSFPLFLSLAARPVLLVGGGPTAVTKARLLLAAGARLTVVDAAPHGDFYNWAYEGVLQLRRRGYRGQDLEDAQLVVIAEDDAQTARLVAQEAEAAGLLVTVAGRPDLGNTVVPAIIDRGSVIAAVDAPNAEPALADSLRQRIETELPPRIGELADFAKAYRPRVQAAFPEDGERKRFWSRFFEGPIAEAFLAGQEETAQTLTEQALKNGSAESIRDGRVILAGTGPGDPELLTLKAFRHLQSADAIVYDRLVSEEVLALAHPEAERHFAGKAPDRHSKTQEEINDLLIALARAGKSVLRLKGGDPFVFGRGGEELEALEAAGIAVEIVPGITAATGCAAAAGFPLTHRDHASAVTFVSGHLKNGQVDLDPATLADPRQTLAVYMGVTTAKRTAEQLIRAGRPPKTPVAIIEKGTTARERVLTGRLDDLARLIAAEKIEAPALIVIGEVASLARRHTQPRPEAVAAE